MKPEVVRINAYGIGMHHPLKMRVPIEAIARIAYIPPYMGHHPLKMRVPIEAGLRFTGGGLIKTHHPLKMRVPIEAGQI